MKPYQVIPGRLLMYGYFKSLPREKKLAELGRHGVDVVVSVMTGRDDDLVDAEGITYKHVPLSDVKAVPVEDAHRIARYVASCIDNGLTVLVHCAGGRNRSGLVTALAARYVLDLSGDEAVDLVKAARPAAFTNKDFEAYVRGLNRLT